MKCIRLIPLLLLALVWSCRQKAEVKKPIPEQAEQETSAIQPLSPIAKEVGNFAGIPMTDSTDIDQLVDFKAINENGDVEIIDLKAYLKLYKIVINGTDKSNLPIFEIKGTDKTILTLGGRGYGGAVWAHILTDRKSLEIEKIKFDHKAESEGYGAQMTQSSFEDRFVGAKIDLASNTFGLRKGDQDVLKGSQMIDAISGATTTSKVLLDMINEGLQNYKGYLTGTN